ncbi:MAG TPA: ATP-binding protein [Bryobacteraceae bacterium]|jgi:signal transduction histidine kinase
MLEFFHKLFSTDFMPHVYCLRVPGLIWMHALSDGFVALSYVLIPAALIDLIRRRRDLVFHWMFVLFAVFILSCGATHVMGIVTLWSPAYRLDGLIKAITAAASLPTAFLLWRLVPEMAAIPSPARWRQANEELESEIQERKRAEQEIWILNLDLEKRVEERTRELEQKNRQLEDLALALRRTNAELEQFAYAAAHDLQEPLRNIALGTQLLASRYRNHIDSKTDPFIEFTVSGAQRMESMIKDLLAYCRALDGSAAPVKPVESAAVLENALRNLKTRIDEAGAQITWSQLPSVAMHETHLLQVFQNLVSNALKYSSTEPTRIQIAASREGNEWIFSVRDNGIGIAPQYHDRIFGVFKRIGGRSPSGSGIGLAICKRVIEHYGGRIWVRSEENRGATFFFTAPMDRVILHELHCA